MTDTEGEEIDIERAVAECAASHNAADLDWCNAELQRIFVALNPECPAAPGQPNTCHNTLCDCFGAHGMAEQVRQLVAKLREAEELERCVTATLMVATQITEGNLGAGVYLEAHRIHRLRCALNGQPWDWTGKEPPIAPRGAAPGGEPT